MNFSTFTKPAASSAGRALWRGVKAGRYAKPIKIGPQSVRWRLSELEADIARMVAERDNAAA
jgi:predicted DNA-binding transcriptional regulator AlpA